MIECQPIMDDRPKITLDYSSPAMETRPEIERMRAVEDYNEATDGERHPFRGPFLRLTIFIALLAIPFFLIPGYWIRRDVCLIMCIIFPFFELWWRRYR